MDNWIATIENNWESIAARAEAPARRAAVLLPLIRDAEGNTAILFQHRAKDLDVQPDEISFPGGGIEAGETPEEAALRETCEELLITPDNVRILGEFDGLGDHSVLTIHTYAGILEDYAGTFSKEEVDHVFTVPLDWFFAHPPEAYKTTLTTVPSGDFPFERIPGGRNYPWRSRENTIYFFQYEAETIWGLTARILVRFLEKAKPFLETNS